jgi:hypothetical protein
MKPLHLDSSHFDLPPRLGDHLLIRLPPKHFLGKYRELKLMVTSTNPLIGEIVAVSRIWTNPRGEFCHCEKRIGHGNR